MSEIAFEVFSRLRKDLPLYAENCLKIADKQGKQVAFTLNRAQQYVHERLQEQKAATGRVRALILKGRQQGVSTYVEARFFWLCSMNTGLKAVVMAHKADSTSAIFGMVRRYLDNLPEIASPTVSKASASELAFSKLDSSYRVATAGSDSIGRGWTAQLLHGSEFAFWPQADEHFSGIGQAIADLDGTEVILESTANSVGDAFHQRWQDAEAGRGDYIAIFVPWFWQPEYARAVPDDFVLSDADADYARQHGLTDEQMAWRAAKVTEFKGDVLRFQREYPATPSEAFAVADGQSFIGGAAVMAARKCTVVPEGGPLVVGVDPARYGDDRTGIVVRRGRKVISVEAHDKKSTMEVVGITARLIGQLQPAKVFIDVCGLGAGVYDRLCELGYHDKVMAVNAANSSDQEGYDNKRAEMWGEMRDWLDAGPVSIPDDDVLQADLIGPGYTYTSNGKLQLESKEKMKKRGIRSPDLGDALALTFAYPVAIATNSGAWANTAGKIGDSYAGY
jgi:hypothetical protein